LRVKFIGWMYDIAREQSPREDNLRSMLESSLEAGYNAVGFYLEHRFAYRNAPWAEGDGCLQPGVVRQVTAEFRGEGLRIIPFLNILGHMEGFIRSEGGQFLAEGATQGSGQMCPSKPENIAFAEGLIDSALESFDDEWVHLGGDETNQLGQCELCSARAERIGKDGIYADYFVPMCEKIVRLGKRPCLWGDMLIEYPSILDRLPKETIIFDWHYAESPAESTKMFRDKGFDVVCCPAVRSYDSFFCHLRETWENVDTHAKAAGDLDALGVLVTTWEFQFFTNYESTLPIVYSAGRRLSSGMGWEEALLASSLPEYVQMANAMGIKAEDASPFLAWPGWRRLRQAFVLSQNPFFLWRDWRGEVCGEVGDKLLAICAPFESSSHEIAYPAILLATSVRWVRAAETAYLTYTDCQPQRAAELLAESAALFDAIESIAVESAKRGGSAADVERAKLLRSRILTASERIRSLGEYLPAFETITHPGYVAGDQAAWRTGQY
jgi:hypothetical protein